MVDQAALRHEFEHVDVVIKRRPWRERYKRRPQGYPRGGGDIERGDHIGAGVPFVEMVEDAAAQGLNRRDNEDAAEAREFRNQRGVFDDVFNLGGEIKREQRELVVQGARDLERMGWPVEEVRIAEGDVASARRRKRPDRIQDYVFGHHKETAAVDRRDR